MVSARLSRAENRHHRGVLGVTEPGKCNILKMHLEDVTACGRKNGLSDISVEAIRIADHVRILYCS